jgi:hypothetical protein
MTELSVPGGVPARLNWDYSVRDPRIQRLYAEARQLQWHEGRDIDWSAESNPPAVESPFGRDAFDASPLARYGDAMWRRFRREQQAWMVGQFLHGEQSALVVTARLAVAVPDVSAKGYAASQAAEEARHLAAFARYTQERVTDPYPVCPAFERLLEQILADREWDILALGMQIMIESLALAAFRLASTTFEDPLIRRITHLAARDEARHVSFGVLLLDERYLAMSETERRYREDFVLEAADLLSRRYLMTDVWARLGVDATDGADFARTNEMMTAYRRTIFARVVHTLNRIGLMTPRVRAGFTSLQLVRDAPLPGA